MTLQTTITSDINATQRHLASAPTRIRPSLADHTAQAAQAIRVIMQRESHVKTGRMRAAEAVRGPYAVGVGSLEAQIGPFGVSYAEHEVARGGAHDFIGRTIAASVPVLDRLAREFEDVVIAEIER